MVNTYKSFHDFKHLDHVSPAASVDKASSLLSISFLSLVAGFSQFYEHHLFVYYAFLSRYKSFHDFKHLDHVSPADDNNPRRVN